MKSITINGRRFEVHKSKYTRGAYFGLERYAGRTLYQCYTKPSIYKIEVYESWCKWAYETDTQFFGVSSYNTFGFSLQGLVEYEGTMYLLHITSTANKAYIIEE